MPQSKVDLYKQHKAEYAATRNPALVKVGKAQYLHHEIYLSDPRRVAPEKLKTILRMPVAAKRP